MKSLKAIIPVAGLGTKMLPATKAIPKEMLPIFDKPIIQNIVDECYQAGIKDIIFITHSSKRAIENHFDNNFELEVTLERKFKIELLTALQDICPPDINFIHIRQGEAKGIADALNQAKILCYGEPFAVLLPDVLINKYTSSYAKDNLADMINRFNDTGISQLLVRKVPMNKTQDYGIVKLSEDKNFLNSGERQLIFDMLEKPAPGTSQSDLAIVGRYVVSSEIWPLFDKTPINKNGEFEFTDALRLLLKNNPIEALMMRGDSFDCGTKLGYLKAYMTYAYHDAKIHNDIVPLMKKCC